MEQVPSPEPEASSRLMFMPQQGAPIEDPAIRKHLKQQVMQLVGRYRRKRGLKRRQQALQYSLEVSDRLLRPAPLSIPPETASGDYANQSGGILVSEALPEQCCNSVAWRAVDSGWAWIDRLGAGWQDSFAQYPFKLDDRARELIHAMYSANSGMVSPFTVIPFRLIWAEVSMTDAAAFHQYLAGAQAYFDFLRNAQAETFSVEVVAHHTYSLRLINVKFANAQTAASDGVIASVLLLARYYQMIGDFRKWHMHMLGLKEIIHLRGEIDHIGMNETLRNILSTIDISGSFALDATPIFPIPAKLLPPPRVTSPSSPLEPRARYLINIWRSRFPEHIQLIDILNDISIESVHFREQILWSKGSFWTETMSHYINPSMYVYHYINPLMHRLLCLPKIDRTLSSSLAVEALRLGAAIYVAVIRYAFGISPLQSGFQMRKVKVLLDRMEYDGK